MDRASVITCALVSATVIVGCGGAGGEVRPGGDPGAAPRRIISLSPSLTETLFALGLGDRVVGVTRYCAFPAEARGLPKVGGHLDPNFEAIVVLEPDLVMLIPSSHENRLRLESLGVPVLEVDQRDVGSILESVSKVAQACGVPERGADLRAEMERRLEKVVSAVAGADRPRTVIVVGHQIGAGAVRSVWAAGRDTFYDGVLDLAGGANAVVGGPARYPELSREGLAALDPDVVLDVIAGLDARNLDLETVIEEWRRLTELRAVRDNRVVVLEGDRMVVPGPRLPEIVEEVARALHPEIEWGAD